VVFGTKVVEVATFRAEAEVTRPPGGPAGDRKAKERPDPGRAGASPHTLLVTWENTFGTPEQDAKRRDFTINALFYDISSYSLIDYVQGLKDLHRGMIRTIGDPDIRFQEDPVRMMRAVKFAARLEFRIESRTYASMRRHAAAIQLSAPPRVLEEIYRLLGSGKARKSFGLLHESGLLPHLIPEVASALKSDPQPTWSILDQLDRLMEQGAEPVSRALQMATLLDQVVRRECLEPAGPGDNLGERIQRVIRPLAQRLRMTRADTARMQQIFLAQRRFTLPKARRLSVNAFLKRGYFADSFQLFRMHALSTGEHQEDVASWEKRRHGVLTAEEIKPARERRRRMGAGRGRRRRRSRGGRVRTRS
ncbi:MAG: hypothetical protein ACE5ID_06890, partial [Acidobacteriota bacterium]